MSQEGVELIKAGFDLVLAGDPDAFEEFMASDVVMVQPPEVPDSKSYVGPTAMREAMADWPSQWEDFRMELLEVVDAGADVYISATRHRGHGRESGIEMDFNVFYVQHLRDGKLARLEMFFSHEQALEVGLSE